MQGMDGPLQPSHEFPIVTSKPVERLCLLLEDGIDSIRRVAALQLDDEAVVEQVCSCLFLIFPESDLDE